MPKFNPLDAAIGVAGMNPVGGVVGAIVGQVLKRHDVPMDNADVPATVQKVASAMAEQAVTGGIAVVPVKSGWFSKINWVQFAGPVCSVLAAFGLSLKPDELVGLIVAVQTVQSIATWVIRQWFTKSVTASAMKGT